jgi:uncharacterized protein
MKFQPDTFGDVNAISRHDSGSIWVGPQRFEHSLILPWRGEVQAWGATDADSLTATHFERLVALQAELVVFGSGHKLRFVKPSLYRSLIEARIGLETMDTAAACRTYNVLASEGRRVVAALIVQAAA